MDLGTLLRNQSLERFEAAFRDNGIDESVLPHLTQDHLRELGIPLGARIKLLAAIAGLAKESESHTPAAMTAEGAPADAAERRQITVLFSDLVGSTALSTRMDPEDLRKLISAYQKCVTDSVHRFGGFVAKYMGDGVLVYFGYPEAHENDAESAVRSALALVENVGKLETHTRLQTRVGIATGLVVVGDLVGSGQAQERGIVGETPNLAARLQGFAEPDTVVIAEATKQLLGNLFELRDLGHQELKGINGAVKVWAALQPSSVESRFEAFHPDNLTAVVGRDEEIDLLLRRWELAKQREGSVVLISGEAGIGKSRVAQELLIRLRGELHTHVQYFCSPHHTDSALYPLIVHFERIAKFRRKDTSEKRLAKLEAVLARATNNLNEAVPPLADLLSIPTGERYQPLDLDPRTRKEKTLQALLAQAEGLAARQPVAMVFEDVHWSDPTTRELLDMTIDRIANLPMLLIITFRSEFTPPWTDRSHVKMLTLNRLSARQRAKMITQLTGENALPKEIAKQIVDRTDGVPLFIEELTKSVIESGLPAEVAGHRARAGPLPALAIPTSLQASLLARLDRLAPTREVAQVGAALGRSFSHELISAVAGIPTRRLEESLHQLASAGLIFQSGTPPDAEYTFKHALVQDAAYGTMLRSRRQQLHGRIAATLEIKFPQICQARPELLARHCAEAGLIELAVGYLRKAGEREIARGAMIEALAQLGKGLDLLSTLPENQTHQAQELDFQQIASLPSTPALRREEIKLQVALITPLMHFRGYGATETKAAALRAKALIERAEARGEAPEDPLLLFSVLYSFWVANFNGFHAVTVTELAAQFLKLAEEQDAATPRVLGHRLVGISQAMVGNLADASTHLDRAIESYNPTEHRQFATRFGQDIRVGALCYRGWILWMLGYPDAALADGNGAVKGARESGQGIPLLDSLFFTSYPLIHRGEFAAASAQLDELILLLTEKNASQWRGRGLMHRGCIRALTGSAADAVELIPSGIAACRSSGSILFVPWYVSHLARACAELGRFDEAWRHIDEALAAIEQTGETWCESDVRRTAGEIALLAPEPDFSRAEAHFERALAIAREQQAKSWELRAAMSLARLWRDRGERVKARELLVGVYDWFREGFETLDLQRARTLLHELG